MKLFIFKFLFLFFLSFLFTNLPVQAFETEKLAKDFELYLKSGSGRAFSYKRLVK